MAHLAPSPRELLAHAEASPVPPEDPHPASLRERLNRRGTTARRPLTRFKVATALFVVAASACSGDKISVFLGPGGPDRLTVRISADQDTLLFGTSKLFSASVVNQYNARQVMSVAWKSTNTGVVTVNSEGMVTAIRAGSAQVLAEISGSTDTLQIGVTLPISTTPAEGAIALERIGPTLAPGIAAALGGAYADYDVLWARWEPMRWAADSSAWESANYYDRAQIYYAQWIRTGNAVYKQRGDAIALDYRRKYLEANAFKASAHWAQLDGLALHYWLNGDRASLVALGRTAAEIASTAQWKRTDAWTEGRQQARALTALLLGWQTNAPDAPRGGWAVAIDKALDAILVQQSPDGGWRYANTCGVSLNYMSAMLSDALIRVHTEYRPDPRIPDAVRKTADFLWTQWREKDRVPSFHYYEKVCSNIHGTGGPTATPDLTGIYTSMYAWMAAQDPAYRSKSDAVFNSAMKGMYPQGSKQFNQAFAYGWRALGYLR